ncbi:SAM-dependent methyltransferase [Actinocrinis puniceicyclus]|uniref:SAM-dependent methyltransferase n=1 Tax=Actinocrinis puniceicyclus TaxID=977794 RepID=A0A8J7WQ58_9ACTN|nr:SAM-dependent methyltransferase [Actinocrinis puniceicyclus]MBS2963989.1 SAM-dependent methyltransferase [Actinocrinis puniceicyclus]
MVDTGKAHPARVYDYWLGGKDHFAADRLVAERVAANAPEVTQACRENRAFVGRAVRILAAGGARQFLDIGTGFPTMGNSDEAAHAVAPDAHVVCVDNDPVVLAHSRALLARRRPEHTTVLAGDLRDPRSILTDPQLREVIDFGRPVVLLLAAILHFIPDSDEPAAILAAFRDAMAPGSHLVLSHATYDFNIKVLNNSRVYRDATAPFVPRSGAQIAVLLDGFEPLEPGLVDVADWRPDGTRPLPQQRLNIYGVVARKP